MGQGDLEKAAQWLMSVEEMSAAKAGMLNQMHEEQQVFESQLQEENVRCAQLCLEEFLSEAPEDDLSVQVVTLNERLGTARAAFKNFDFDTGRQEAGSVAGELNKLLRHKDGGSSS